MQRLPLILTAGPATILAKLKWTKRRNVTLPKQNKMSILTSSTFKMIKSLNKTAV